MHLRLHGFFAGFYMSWVWRFVCVVCRIWYVSCVGCMLLYIYTCVYTYIHIHIYMSCAVFSLWYVWDLVCVMCSPCAVLVCVVQSLVCVMCSLESETSSLRSYRASLRSAGTGPTAAQGKGPRQCQIINYVGNLALCSFRTRNE